MRWGTYGGTMRSAYSVLVGKANGRNYPESLGIDLGCNIKIDLKEMGWDDMDWIDLVQDRDNGQVLINTVINKYNAGNFWTR
jgi:hypothetical protein